jgi:hypothetical protein
MTDRLALNPGAIPPASNDLLAYYHRQRVDASRRDNEPEAERWTERGQDALLALGHRLTADDAAALMQACATQRPEVLPWDWRPPSFT